LVVISYPTNKVARIKSIATTTKIFFDRLMNLITIFN
jgi:hypothetical protein